MPKDFRLTLKHSCESQRIISLFSYPYCISTHPLICLPISINLNVCAVQCHRIQSWNKWIISPLMFAFIIRLYIFILLLNKDKQRWKWVLKKHIIKHTLLTRQSAILFILPFFSFYTLTLFPRFITNTFLYGSTSLMPSQIVEWQGVPCRERLAYFSLSRLSTQTKRIPITNTLSLIQPCPLFFSFLIPFGTAKSLLQSLL